MRLLQRSAAWHSGRDDPQATASAEQRPRIVLQAPKRSDAKPLLRTLPWLPVKQRIIYKTGRPNVQGPEHRNPSLPLPPHKDTRLCAEPSLVGRTIAGTTFQEN